MRCHFYWDEETKQKILIPGCYGSMHREDLSCCTCGQFNKSIKQYEKEEYNKHVSELQDEIDYLQKENNRPIRIIANYNQKSKNRTV